MQQSAGDARGRTGTTVLAFDDDGLVVDHRDHWNQEEERVEHCPGW
jgi:hypothetical protein